MTTNFTTYYTSKILKVILPLLHLSLASITKYSAPQGCVYTQEQPCIGSYFEHALRRSLHHGLAAGTTGQTSPSTMYVKLDLHLLLPPKYPHLSLLAHL